jgi:ABC-type transport system involved in cytochrome bd biosynthesis fused ATPase/permease subunit
MLRERLDAHDKTARAARTIQRLWRSMRNRSRLQQAVHTLLARHRRSTVDSDGSALSRGQPERLLAWSNLSVSLKSGKVLVHAFDAAARGGRVLALMGPSGAGKTTLLNGLSGRAAYAKVCVCVCVCVCVYVYVCVSVCVCVR